MLHISKNTGTFLAFCFTFVICMITYIAWGESMNCRLGTRSLYEIFPLLGLLAFSILWSQYVVLAGLRLLQVSAKKLSGYFTVTGWIFLILIFLHPGLLIWQLWRDGFGLPPESYLQHYIAPGLEWAVLLGSVSFLIFLSYELRRWYGGKPWWKFVTYASDAAALAIFVHSLKLGTTLQAGWFQSVWIGYGITLIAALLYLRIYPLFKGYFAK